MYVIVVYQPDRDKRPYVIGPFETKVKAEDYYAENYVTIGSIVELVTPPQGD